MAGSPSPDGPPIDPALARLTVAEVLRLAIAQNASDAIITAGVSPALRVNGELFYTKAPPCSRRTPSAWSTTS